MRTLAIGLALLLMVGCSRPPMRGIVIKKNYRGAWVQYVSVSTGKSVVIMPVHHPEQWDIVIQADGTTGDTGQHLVVVPRSYWDVVGVGDVWERPDTVQH